MPGSGGISIHSQKETKVGLLVKIQLLHFVCAKKIFPCVL